jgi:hypothetical protein
MNTFSSLRNSRVIRVRRFLNWVCILPFKEMDTDYDRWGKKMNEWVSDSYLLTFQKAQYPTYFLACSVFTLNKTLTFQLLKDDTCEMCLKKSYSMKLIVRSNNNNSERKEFILWWVKGVMTALFHILFCFLYALSFQEIAYISHYSHDGSINPKFKMPLEFI